MDRRGLELAVAAVPVAMMVLDTSGRCVNASDRYRELMGTNPLGHSWLTAVESGDRPEVVSALARVRDTRKLATVRCRIGAPDRWVELAVQPLVDEKGRWYGSSAVATVELGTPLLLALDDRSDPLTGAANREAVVAHLESLLDLGPDMAPTSVGVVLVDLDNFKSVNERLGRAAGDELLGAVAGRLRGAVRFCDLVGRLEADRFLLVTEQDDDPMAAEKVAERVLAVLNRPFRLRGANVRLDGSLGIAIGDRTDSAADLLRRAGEASLLAKTAGGGCWRRANSLRLLMG